MKWLEDLEDMLVTFANHADGPESPEAINAGILAEAIKEAKRLREQAERAERDWSRLMDLMITDQGESAGKYRFGFRGPVRKNGMIGWWARETREEAESLLREKWGLAAAPVGEGGAP